MNVRCPECLTMYRIDPAKVARRVRARCAHCSGLLTIEKRATHASPQPPDEVRASHASLQPLDQVPASHALPRQHDEVRATEASRQPHDQIRATEASPRQHDEVRATEASPQPLDEVRATEASPQPLDEVRATEASPQPLDEVRATEASPEPAVHVSPPFVQPRAARETQPPARPKRPSAPVFRPTPGMPIQAVPVAPPSRPTAGVGGALDSGDPDVGGAPGSSVVTAPDSLQRVNPFLSRDPRERARRLARALVSDIIVYQPKKRRQALQDGTLPEVFREEIGKSWKEYRQQMGEEFASSTPYFTEALNEILAEGRQIF